MPDWNLLTVYLLIVAGAIVLAILAVPSGRRFVGKLARPDRIFLWTGLLILSLLTVALVALGSQLIAGYGLGLFLLLPFIVGFAAAALAIAFSGTGSRWVGLEAAAGTLAFGAVWVLLIGLDGLVCLLMALPLAIVAALLGAELAWRLRRRLPGQSGAFSGALLLLLTAAPLLMGTEAAVQPPPSLYHSSTAVDVDAPPEVVWRYVISFGTIPPPREWIFRAGIAYPVRAAVRGSGPGALRLCVFSTGSFVEPIEVWDAPRRLVFSVLQSPPQLNELSPWPGLHPPHLDGFIASERGELRLEPLPGGRTRLVGTSWYRQDLQPAFYWRLWSDALVHRVHRRVLEHIRRLSEEDAQYAGWRPVTEERKPSNRPQIE
jgi:MFS family permease